MLTEFKEGREERLDAKAMITLFGVPYSGQNGLRTARSEFPWERRGEGRERRDIAIRRGMPREMREREKTITMNYSIDE